MHIAHYDRLKFIVREGEARFLPKLQAFYRSNPKASLKTLYLAFYNILLKEHPSSDPLIYLSGCQILCLKYCMQIHGDRIGSHYSFSKHFSYEFFKDFGATVSAVMHEMMLGAHTIQTVMHGVALNINHNFAINAYEKAGMHRYEVSDGLALQLLRTDLRGLTGEDMRLPFPAVIIDVPDILGFKIYDMETGYHDVDSVYVIEDKDDDVWYEGISPARDGPGHTWRILISGYPKDDQIDNDTTKFFGLKFRDGLSTEESLSDFCKHCLISEMPSREKETFMNDDWQRIWKWVLNVMVYATTPDAEREAIRTNPEAAALWNRIEKSPKGSLRRKMLHQKLREMDERKRIVLGSKVRLDRSLLHPESEATGTGGKLNRRVLVSGHFRRYRVGPGRQETRVNWLEPFYRGPEDAPVTPNVTHRLTHGN